MTQMRPGRRQLECPQSRLHGWAFQMDYTPRNDIARPRPPIFPGWRRDRLLRPAPSAAATFLDFFLNHVPLQIPVVVFTRNYSPELLNMARDANADHPVNRYGRSNQRSLRSTVTRLFLSASQSTHLASDANFAERPDFDGTGAVSVFCAQISWAPYQPRLPPGHAHPARKCRKAVRRAHIQLIAIPFAGDAPKLIAPRSVITAHPNVLGGGRRKDGFKQFCKPNQKKKKMWLRWPCRPEA